MAWTNDELQFSSLYLTRFATSFGFMTVLTLLPDYIDALGATGVRLASSLPRLNSPGRLVSFHSDGRVIGIASGCSSSRRYS